jgi:hypothetical protein
MRKKHLTISEKEELIGLRNSGATYPELAKKYRISERRAMQIVKNTQKKPEISDVQTPTPEQNADILPENSAPTTVEPLQPQPQTEILPKLEEPHDEAPQPEEKKLDEILPLTDEDKKFNSAEELGAPKVQPENSAIQISKGDRAAAVESASRFICDAVNMVCDSQLQKPLTENERKTMINYGKSFWEYYLPENASDKTIVLIMYSGAIVSIGLARQKEIKTYIEKRKQLSQNAA